MAPDMEEGLSPHLPAAPVKHEEILRFVMLSALILAASIALALFVLLFPDPDRHQDLVPTFSVDLAGFDGLDLDGATTVVSPTFNLTLHRVSSRRSSESWEQCNERGTVAVSYAGAVLAWGRVSGFSVTEGAQKHVRMVALGAGVRLSDELRGRMASEKRSAEVDVDIVLDSYRNTFLSCRVKLDDEPSPRPSPCKVLVPYLWCVESID